MPRLSHIYITPSRETGRKPVGAKAKLLQAVQSSTAASLYPIEPSPSALHTQSLQRARRSKAQHTRSLRSLSSQLPKSLTLGSSTATATAGVGQGLNLSIRGGAASLRHTHASGVSSLGSVGRPNTSPTTGRSSGSSMWFNPAKGVEPRSNVPRPGSVGLESTSSLTATSERLTAITQRRLNAETKTQDLPLELRRHLDGRQQHGVLQFEGKLKKPRPAHVATAKQRSAVAMARARPLANTSSRRERLRNVLTQPSHMSRHMFPPGPLAPRAVNMSSARDGTDAFDVDAIRLQAIADGNLARPSWLGGVAPGRKSPSVVVAGVDPRARHSSRVPHRRAVAPHRRKGHVSDEFGFSAKSKRKILRKSASARFLRGTSNTALPRAGGQGGRTTRPLASPVVTHASGAAPPAFLTDSPGIPSPIGTPIRVGTGFRTTATTSSGSRTASPSSLPGDDDDDDAVSQVSAFEPDVDLRPQTTPAMVRSVARPMTTAVKARQPSAHSHLRVKPLQVKIMEQLNRVRMTPSSYIAVIEQRLQHMDDMGVFWLPHRAEPIATVEGKAVFLEAMHFLRTQPPVRPLELSHGLCFAAYDHAIDIGMRGRSGHEGTDGSTVVDRFNRYGTWGGGVAENILYAYDNAVDIVVAMVVDDGVEHRGNRMNLFNPDFSVVGIATGPHRDCEHVCVIDMAMTYVDGQAGRSASAAPQQLRRVQSRRKVRRQRG